MDDRLRQTCAVALLGAGLLSVGLGSSIALQNWANIWRYQQSPQAQRDERLAGQLQVHPSWEEATPTTTGTPPNGPPTAVPTADAPTAAEGTATPSPVPLAGAEAIELGPGELRFLDPPEAGARARLTLELRNHSDLATPPLSLAIKTDWFAGFQVVAAEPSVLDDQSTPDGLRSFLFPALEPAATVTLTLDLVATDDLVDPPTIEVRLPDGAVIGAARPSVSGPRPRPGPARALSYPRLGITAAVVPTAWEPPAFVVGQIRGSANLGQGNTVLIGHLTGLEGNVFASLDHAQLGDEVVAVSRGVEYRFVVSEIAVLPNDDLGPLQPTRTPRLTLMTCTGQWNPVTRDYSHRLWVIAEPPELAERTIAANAERAAQATATALAPTPTPEPEPTATPPPEPSPTPTAEPTVAPTPTRGSSAPSRPAPPSPAGLSVTSPDNGARVPARVVVKGRRTQPAPGQHIWLLWRPQQGDGRWYPDRQEIKPRADGTWEAVLELGGPSGLRYELMVAVANDAASVALLWQATVLPNEPLGRLPDGFRPEVSIVVERR